MNRIRFKQLIAVNLVTVILFVLAVLAYAIYGSLPFVGLCVVDLIYALASNGYVLLSNDLTSGQEALWRRRFGDELDMIDSARLSIESRRDYLEANSSPAIKNACLEAARRIDAAGDNAMQFLYSYDFVNSPDDNGRMMAYAKEAASAIRDLNDTIDDAFDADGGAGDELDEQIRLLHRFEDDALPDGIATDLRDTTARLEKVSALLHDRPEAYNSFRKLFSYYLPTLVRLLEKYRELSQEGLGGDNINAAKRDITEVIGEMPEAIQRMTDSYYQMDALDVHSEKKVINTLMEQDGLR